MISLRRVTKRFGKRVAVHALNLEVPQGRIFGLLGHNGAGKSTTIGILLGQVYPDEGRVFVAGVDVFADRHHALARVGAIFETPAFYDYLSGATNLRIFCEYTRKGEAKRGKEIVNLVGLEKRIHDRVGTYSHGMRQRLALAQALLPDPQLLILDEPSEGLDPEGMHEIRNLILRLNREWGLTILFSSHLLNEVQQLCSHLAVMQEGRLLFSGEWQQLGLDQSWLWIKVDRQEEAEKRLVGDGLLVGFETDGKGRLQEGRTAADVAKWLVERRFEIKAVTPIERTLEDFYLETVQKDKRVPSSEFQV